jgi:hypothetical protein
MNTTIEGVLSEVDLLQLEFPERDSMCYLKRASQYYYNNRYDKPRDNNDPEIPSKNTSL